MVYWFSPALWCPLSPSLSLPAHTLSLLINQQILANVQSGPTAVIPIPSVTTHRAHSLVIVMMDTPATGPLTIAKVCRSQRLLIVIAVQEEKNFFQNIQTKTGKEWFSPLHPYTHRTQRLVWVPWCDSRNRASRYQIEAASWQRRADRMRAE